LGLISLAATLTGLGTPIALSLSLSNSNSSSGLEINAAPALLVLGLGLANVLTGSVSLTATTFPELSIVDTDVRFVSPPTPPMREGREVRGVMILFARTLGASTGVVGLSLTTAFVTGAGRGVRVARFALEVDGTTEARGARKGCLRFRPVREMDGLGAGCTLALGARFTAPAAPATLDVEDNVVVSVLGSAMDARGRATIEARGAPVPRVFRFLRVGARDARGPGMTDIRGFAIVVVEVGGLAAMEGRRRRFAEPSPPTPALLGLVGVDVIFEGDFGVPCVPTTRLLGEPLRVTPDLLLLIEEMLDVDVVRT
jgi:hypothetical protein